MQHHIIYLKTINTKKAELNINNSSWRLVETLQVNSSTFTSWDVTIYGDNRHEKEELNPICRRGICENENKTQRKRGRKWKMRLAALLQAGTSAQQYLTLSICGHPLSPLYPSPCLSCFIIEAPHKAPFCPCCHQPHFFSALILYEHLRRENTSKGKTRLGHREGWRMMRSQKKNPAFPDQAVWPCDARRRVWVAWWCTGLNVVLLYSYVCV